jgi:hypothetical protein
MRHRLKRDMALSGDVPIIDCAATATGGSECKEQQATDASVRFGYCGMMESAKGVSEIPVVWLL